MGYVLSEVTDWIVCLVSSITVVIGLLDLLPLVSSLIIAVLFIIIVENLSFKVGKSIWHVSFLTYHFLILDVVARIVQVIISYSC